MIRNIITQGNNAYTLTLPKKWVIENNLVGGEVRIVENSNGLNIIPLSTSSIVVKSTTITLHNDTPETYRSIIGSLYRHGYDEITLNLESSEQVRDLEHAISTLFGLELFIESEKECLIKSIYSSENTSIHMHILRIIAGVEMMQQTIISDLKLREFNSFDEITRIRNSILKQRDLIIRLVKKSSNERDFAYYTIAMSLWGVARNYYHLYCNLNLESCESVYMLDVVNSFVLESFSYLKKKEKKNVLNMYSQFDNLRKSLQGKLLENVIVSFSYHIIIETQLSYGSIYILGVEE